MPDTYRPACRIGRLAMLALAATVRFASPGNADPVSENPTLKGAAEFSSISNSAERSRMIFNEIGKVLTHPRCMNCHPAGDHPLQGDDHHEHMPPVWRAE